MRPASSPHPCPGLQPPSTWAAPAPPPSPSALDLAPRRRITTCTHRPDLQVLPLAWRGNGNAQDKNLRTPEDLRALSVVSESFQGFL